MPTFYVHESEVQSKPSPHGYVVCGELYQENAAAGMNHPGDLVPTEPVNQIAMVYDLEVKHQDEGVGTRVDVTQVKLGKHGLYNLEIN